MCNNTYVRFFSRYVFYYTYRLRIYLTITE
nr:MAG TPA: hypothetical protein [Caudoviricetes sp.]